MKLKKGLMPIVCLILATSLLLPGCSSKQEDAAPINIALNDDLVSLDVAGTKDIVSETVGRCVFSTLYTFDETLSLTPCLAKSAQQLSDCQWQFTLRKDTTFHNGQPLTSKDVVFSINRAMSIELAEQGLLIIDSIEAPDDYTIIVTTKDPVANLPSLFVRTSTSIMSEQAMSDPSYDINKPVGSGPFQVISRTEGQGVELKRYDNYFGGTPKTEYLNFVVNPEESNSTAAILNGNVDILYRVSASDADYLDLNESVNVYQSDSTKTEMLITNPLIKPMDDIRVRQAIACAIDKQNLVDNVLSGYGRPQSSMIPAPLLGFSDFEEYSYDPDRASQLLAQAGYPDGFNMTVYTFDAQRKKLMEYIKLDLAKVNINLNYEFLELKDYLSVIERREQMGSVMSWTSNADPDSTLTQLFSKAGHVTVNQSGFSDERVEQLLIQGRMETDPDKRDEIYRQANQIIAGSYYVLPLYQPAVLVAARADIEGVRVNPQGIFGYESLYRQIK